MLKPGIKYLEKKVFGEEKYEEEKDTRAYS